MGRTSRGAAHGTPSPGARVGPSRCCSGYLDAVNTSKTLADAERIDRLRLIRSDNVGPPSIKAQTLHASAPSTDHLKRVVFARLNDWSLYRVVGGGL